jgi:hypothetical protein
LSFHGDGLKYYRGTVTVEYSVIPDYTITTTGGNEQ